ncbi:3-oxoacyl-[acyl-carrier protein] reductase [Cytobacillus oceanisediminis]|jgi:3-oxoacyl-[acyl-carrier protein] reductase|uniref:3-oxoacyl-[acyl-carrier protein] reductase n=1 Tax=Cytobacillus oceanisediminis TaxID=665099 RepID=A0A2V2ZLW1_9BACI|nr:3-oxoacyl-ACP reductase family protein [Cytobacillus oceanisediminis]PWW20853.1 3-oxoacyl-[acyl-carrier protein] reductase [Cytobacillus oceanisediminis]
MNTDKKQVALITGGSSGIGQASAKILAGKGYAIVAAYNSNAEGAEKTKQLVEQAGSECLIVKADVTIKEEVQRLVEETLNAFGQIDILVNNAGAAIKRSSFLEIDEELWEKTYDVNVKSVFLVSQTVLKHMVPRKSGRIINISSVAARLGGPGESIHYASAKGAVNTLTVGLSKEFAPHGILVNGIAPGFILTPFQDKYSTQERIDRIVPTIPIGRAGTSEDIAKVVAFLASDSADYMMGEIITVSGGR